MILPTLKETETYQLETQSAYVVVELIVQTTSPEERVSRAIVGTSDFAISKGRIVISVLPPCLRTELGLVAAT